jgi:phosphoglycerate dehydrogenase-like enzyme
MQDDAIVVGAGAAGDSMNRSVSIVIPDDFPPAYAGTPELAQLREMGEVRLYGDRVSSPNELVERLYGAQFMVNVRAYTAIDAELLSRLPGLCMIAVFGTGTDNIDLEAAAALGISVTNAPGANARSVAEHSIALIFAVARAIPQHDRALREGVWRHEDGTELEGKTLGVIGLGNVGGRVAAMASALGMRVVAWSITPDRSRAARAGATLVELDELLRVSDVVSLNIALSDRTRGLIGERELGLMRSSAILVNTARGALVDEPALIRALAERRIGGAGLDVFAVEPLPAESPLLQLDNVVLTPHSGWVTDEARKRVLAMPVYNIREYIGGRPVNVVNPGSLAASRWSA